MADDRDKWCFAWHAGPEGEARAAASAAGIPPDESSQMRAALRKGSKWSPGATIEASFLDGTDASKARVKKYAMEWTGPSLANLRIVFRTDTQNTPIRISFQHPGSWSSIGTSCRQVPAGQPTMNFGWLDGASDDEARRVVLHEFGHALGLIHEHQSPGGTIKWNKEVVYNDLSGPPNNWSKAVIDFNMFTPFAASETNFSALDGKSIMMYPIPKSWTTDGYTVGLNGTLSNTDKTFIHGQYK